MLPGEALKSPQETGSRTTGEDTQRHGLQEPEYCGLGFGEIGLNERQEQLRGSFRITRKVTFVREKLGGRERLQQAANQPGDFCLYVDPGA